MGVLLEIQGLSKLFQDGEAAGDLAVDQVTFSLCEGETLGIVGESGCGKSTLARLIARLIPPTAGRILLDGQDITDARGKKRREIYRQMQMVFQFPAGSFDPRRTIGYGVGESLANSGVPKKERAGQVAALLEQCGLPAAFAQRYPHEISGGECQRAAIARALAVRPRLLICDEVTSALDMTVQQQIMALLATLRRQRGLSYLFICHNLALVQSFCDRVLVMHDGAIVEEGTPEQIIRAPKAAYTRRLVEAAF